MDMLTAFSIFLTAAALLLRSSESLQLPVGGKQGWVVDPAEKYSHWAERLRFQVNDTLYFKYAKGTDSVLLVNKSDYDNCNASAPVKSFTDGDSTFRFDRSGPFFFISGFADHCSRGQKLCVVVMSENHHKKPSPPSPQSPPSPAPVAPAPKSVVAPPPPSAAESPSDDAPSSAPASAPTQSANINSGAGTRFAAGSGLVGLGVMVVAAGFVGMV
ncbi:Early nodulin-like protein 2 [Linum perenne]